MKNWQLTAKFFLNRVLRSKVLPGPLTYISVLVGFLHLKPQQGVKYQLFYFDFFRGDPINIS
jgi:hypothetical protein